MTGLRRYYDRATNEDRTVDIKDSLKEAAASQAKIVSDAAAAQAALARDAAAAHARVVMSDLWHAIRKERSAQIMVLILILTIVCGDVPGIKEFLYPFSMFKTMIHESGHAIAARLSGGHVSAVALNPFPDALGATFSHGGSRLLILPAGYMGLAIFGGLLIWWGRDPKGSRLVLQSIGTAMLAITLFYGSGTIENFLLMAFISASILVIARKASEHFCHLFLLFLAVQTSLDAIISLKGMIVASAVVGGVGDCKGLEEITGIPSLVWAATFAVSSIAIFLFAFWLAYRPPASKRPQELALAAASGPASAQQSDAGRSGDP